MKIQNIKWSTKNIDFLEQNQLMSEIKVSPYYLGNPYLRKPNLPFNYTEDELIEIEQYKTDFYNFFNSIPNNIIWRQYQKEAIDKILENRIGNIYSSRQMGWSIMMSYITFYLLNIHNNYRINCIFPGQSQGYHLIDLIKDLYMKQSFFAKKGILSYNNGSIRFDNGSSIEIQSAKNYRCGKNFDFIYTEGISQIKESEIYPELIGNLTSKKTARFWRNSLFRNEEFDNDNNIFTNWESVSNRDKSWKESQINMLGEDVFNIEYEPIVIKIEKIREFLKKENISESDFKEILVNL